MSPTDPAAAERLAVQRYGRRRGLGTRGQVLVGAVGLLLLLVGLVWLARPWLDPPVRSGIVSYGEITDDSITVVIDVRRDAGVSATCVVELTTINRLDTRQELEVPAGPQTALRVTHTFTTTQPVGAKLIGCRAPGQRRLA